MDFKTELLNSIQIMINRKLSDYKADRTYKSVIKSISPKGYIVLDETGCERIVKCCIPDIDLKAGQGIWLKEPMGDLKGLHICGVV